MYKNYKIVVNTAAGRRRYMQYLIPYVISSNIVDRYDIWINTHNQVDIEFFKQLSVKFEKINLVWQPDGIVNGNSTINAFYKECVEHNTIYFKLDDDIVWMEPNLIEKMVEFRVDNPQYFLVSPLVINNSLTTYLLQVSGKIKLQQYCNSASDHPILWKSGVFAHELHSWFLRKYLRPNKWENLYIGKKEMGMTRFSINSILWFGEEMKKIEGIVPGDDEEFLSCIYPTKLGISNAWNGDAIVAHFAFFTQRAFLDANHILEEYGRIMEMQNESLVYKIYNEIQDIIGSVESMELELQKSPSPYKKIVPIKTFRSRVKKFIPNIVMDIYYFIKGRKENSGIIQN